jgi:ribonuclease BN (tRNA processing enzyme)
LVKAGLFPTRINYLFFTHHHFDHNADYPCFLLSWWDQNTDRGARLTVLGPPPTRAFTEKLIGEDGAFSPDWKARIGAPVSQRVFQNRGGSLPRPKPEYDVQEIRPGWTMTKRAWSVRSASAHHVEPWLESLAYRIDSADGGSIVFAGDTGPCQSVVELAQGADTLVVNCWDHQEAIERSGEAAGQTGTMDAAKMARESDTQRLILTHTGPSLSVPGSKEKAVSDIGRVFSGQVFFGEELLVLDL